MIWDLLVILQNGSETVSHTMVTLTSGSILLLTLSSIFQHIQITSVLGFQPPVIFFKYSSGRQINSSSTTSPSAAAVVVRMSSTTKRQEINTPLAPAPLGPYSQAVLVRESTLYVSGQIALDPNTGALVGDGDIQAEARQVLKNLGEVLKAAGTGPETVVRCTVFLQDLDNFSAVNEVYADFFKDCPVAPSRSCVQAAALPKGVNVEIDCIAEL